MKKWKDNWPFLGAVLLATVSVDWVIIPWIIEPLGLSFWKAFGITTVLANLELVCWFLFWMWFAWKWLPNTEPVKNVIELAESVTDLLRKYGLLETVIYKIQETFQWAINLNNKPSLKKWGHFSMLFLGAEPFFTGGRLLGVISCVAKRWKAGLVSLCIGNAVHVYVSIKTWKLTFYLWDNHKDAFIIFIIITTLFFIRKWIWKKLTRRNNLLKKT